MKLNSIKETKSNGRSTRRIDFEFEWKNFFFLRRLEEEDEAADEYKPKKRKMIMLVEEGRREETRSFEW